jgi:NADP-dependent 3-hydroxy acid dehydrogenase YdfG
MGSSLSAASTNWDAEGKHVLITGASSGIGAELARNFAKQGASIALLARNKDALSAVAKECTTLGAPQAEIFPCDVTIDSDLKTAIASAVEKFGRFDVLILNAGRSMGCYFEEIKDLDSVNYMLKINVNGVINALFHAMPSVPKSSASRIVFISSVSGIIPVPYRTVYCASKHAIAGFANSLRIELKDTYGQNAPSIQLINFPEVKGTNLNSGRMSFGADLPPIEFITDSRVPTVQKACSSLMKQIILGTSEWGQPLKLKILLPLRGMITNTIDFIILKTVKKTHRRPVVTVK